MLRADSQDSLRNSKLVRLQNQISYLTLNYAAKRDWREAHHCSVVVDPLFQNEQGVLVPDPGVEECGFPLCPDPEGE